MFWIWICIVHLILVTWNDSTAGIICRFFSESNDCWCGSTTTTKKHLKLTFCPNMWKEILTNQIQKTISTKQYLRRHLYPINPSKNILTKNKFKRNLHPKKSSCFRHEKLQKSKLMKLNKNALFHQILSVPILAMLLVMFVFSDFLVEMFLHSFW